MCMKNTGMGWNRQATWPYRQEEHAVVWLNMEQVQPVQLWASNPYYYHANAGVAEP